MSMKEHSLVEEIELITTGFAWWNHKPHREQLSDRLKSFEKQVREEVYEQGKKDLVDKEEAVIEAVDRERERIRSIIEYICNKNSKTLAEGGFNHAQFLMDIEELERELAE